MRTDFQAILFDIDGTLVDSTAAAERIWRTWADLYGVDVEEILRVRHGRRTEDIVAMFLPADQVPEAVAEMGRLELDDLDGIVALPGTRDLLPSLPDHRWAAVTSGAQRMMRARLLAAGLPAPRVMIAAEDVVAGKPDPEGYLKAATALGYDIGECLVIEDAPAGIEAGHAAGACVLAVATTRSVDDLAGADRAIDDLTHCSVAVSSTQLSLTFRDS